jgi:glycosyltransferase involved in cell wall biosynthesis
LKGLRTEYQNVVDVFRKHILREKPDLIVLNGTYFIPWCLYLAAKAFNIPILLHYHGIITKETETWDHHSHLLMKQMEQTFDNSRLQYIFPSELAKTVVEDQVFGHKIANSAILHNSISAHFFEINTKGAPKNIGVVGRWTQIKNPNFVMELAKYNVDNESLFKMNVVTDVEHISKSDMTRLKSVNLNHGMTSLDLGKFYGEMGTIICPSVFESYGNVPQEAVASGTPALVGNNMGIAEVFKKIGLEDYVIDFGSVRDVYEKVKEVGAHRVKKNIRNAMQNELSSDRVNTKLLSIYRQTTH